MGEKCVGDLTAIVGSDPSTVSKHLSIMRAAGIVVDDKRGLQVFYSAARALHHPVLRMRRSRDARERSRMARCSERLDMSPSHEPCGAKRLGASADACIVSTMRSVIIVAALTTCLAGCTGGQDQRKERANQLAAALDGCTAEATAEKYVLLVVDCGRTDKVSDERANNARKVLQERCATLTADGFEKVALQGAYVAETAKAGGRDLQLRAPTRLSFRRTIDEAHDLGAFER